MKKFTAVLLFLFVTGISVQAQSEKYVKAMQGNLSQIDSGFKNPPYLVILANNFERIANAEKSQWLPFYYAALMHVNFAFMQDDQSKSDDVADKATQLLNKADSLMPNNSEISCVRSMIATCRLMVNPMQRYMQYGMESEKHLQTAIAQDSTNPRPHYLKGQSLKYTPEQFGGGCKAAMVEFTLAMNKYAIFKPAVEMSPNWGKEITEKMIAECK